MCDPFDAEAPEIDRHGMWNLIRETPWLDWLLVTKRPENFARMLPEDWGRGYANVWLGVSVEDQNAADERIPHLLAAPAAVRFLSVEPMLGPISLRGTAPTAENTHLPQLHWVIVGGESGPKARPCDVAWIRSIVQQCRAAKVPVFVKQDSGPRPGRQGRIPDDLWIKEFPGVKP